MFLRIVASFQGPTAKVLLYTLLAGRALQISSCGRDTGRQVADALSSFLPNNKNRDSTYFANVVLSASENSEFNYTLTVRGAPVAPTYHFHSRLCTCHGAADSCCTDCSYAGSSTAVGQLHTILCCPYLKSEVVHTKVLAVVQGILHHANIWSKLKHGADKRTFISRMGFAASDAQILNFFQMFLK